MSINESRHAIEFGGRAIDFTLVRSDRQTLGITVRADCSVVVRAPANAALEQIVEKIEKRSGWITAQISRAERFRPRTPPRTFEEGETHLHLGRQYRLAVQLGLAQDVRLEGDRLVLVMHRPGRREERADLLRSWRLREARRHYASRLDALLPSLSTYPLSRPRVVIRDLSHRWGSLTARGNMILSRDLIQAPQACIDYVIMHELCHLVHDDHSDAFFRLLGEVMPDYAARKVRLEKFML